MRGPLVVAFCCAVAVFALVFGLVFDYCCGLVQLVFGFVLV